VKEIIQEIEALSKRDPELATSIAEGLGRSLRNTTEEFTEKLQKEQLKL
jgi:hypothetical protein